MERVNGAGNFFGNQSPVIIPWKLRNFAYRSGDWKKMATILVIYVSKLLGNKLYLPSRYENNQKEYV